MTVSKSGHLVAYGDVDGYNQLYLSMFLSIFASHFIGNLTLKDLRNDEEIFTTNVSGSKMISVKFAPTNNTVIAVTESLVMLYDQNGIKIIKSICEFSNII